MKTPLPGTDKYLNALCDVRSDINQAQDSLTIAYKYATIEQKPVINRLLLMLRQDIAVLNNQIPMDYKKGE